MRQARVRAGLSQDDASAKLGQYRTYVSKCEAGERRIDVIELADFCAAYRASLPRLLKKIK